MVADRSNIAHGFIDFRLQITSCDCNISLSSVIGGSTAVTYCGFTYNCNYNYTSAIYIWLVQALVPMARGMAEPLKCPTGAIHFGLLIASCDCNITTSAHMQVTIL